MLVKRESTSGLSIKNSESSLTIFSVKANESFIVYSLIVKDTRNFTNRY